MKSIRIVVLAVSLALLLGACGDDHASHEGDTPGVAADGHTGHSHDGYAFGEPADATDATETIAVSAIDYAFEPSHLTVHQGDVVQFKVTNDGESEHEFVLGDVALMEDLASTEHQHDADEPNAVARLAPGEEGTMAWNFTQPGRFRYECHIDGHHKLGMTGTITVIGH